MHSDILNAIKTAEKEGLVPSTKNNVLTGLSGNKLVGALQRLSRLFNNDPQAVYLEVGVFQGLTLLSVANANRELSCFGIDNFAKYDPNRQNQSVINDRMKALGIKNAELINQDYEDALETLNLALKGKKVGVYFIDGPHDYRSQLMCLEMALPHLHSNCIILIDDSNYQHVRQANCDFLKTHPDFKLVFDSYTKCHPQNMTESESAEARLGWWNGINIIARDPNNVLPPMFPFTERSRDLFVNENEVQGLKYAEATRLLVTLWQWLCEFNLYRVFTSTWRFWKLASEMRGAWSKRYRFANTYSESLPQSRYNEVK